MVLGVSSRFERGPRNKDLQVVNHIYLAILTYKTTTKEENTGSEHVIYHLSNDVLLLAGPYIVHTSTGCVYSVLKLCEDYNNAFVGGVLRDGPSRFKWLQSTNRIPVPSKMYYNDPTPELPLKGLRFGVKDAIDVAGLETGNGSKCYRELYPHCKSTATCVDRLISAGAIMLGKMRCCQWCDGQDPLERLEEVTPTNPRGDTFQKPSGSSSGSAAGCASYEWLDFTIGTDTGGSVRHPAGVNGLYGIRPSLGSMESSGLVCTAFMDTPGVFARSAEVAEAVCKVMMKDEITAPLAAHEKLRYKLLYIVEPTSSEPTETPKFFSRGGLGPESSTAAGKVLERFVQRLEDHLGCKRQEVCVFDLWKETHPEGTSEDLLEATSDIYQNIVYGQLYRDVVQPFSLQYEQRYGKKPFIEAITQARLEHGANVSDDDLESSIKSLKSFAGWVNQTLLPQPTADGEMTLLIYPQSWGRPQYRDDLTRLKSGVVFWNGFSAYSMSYCSGCPDFTLPIGEVGFDSKFTGRSEHLPVALSLMGPLNMDSRLLNLTRELQDAGVLKPVDSGARLWTEASVSV